MFFSHASYIFSLHETRIFLSGLVRHVGVLWDVQIKFFATLFNMIWTWFHMNTVFELPVNYWTRAELGSCIDFIYVKDVCTLFTLKTNFLHVVKGPNSTSRSFNSGMLLDLNRSHSYHSLVPNFFTLLVFPFANLSLSVSCLVESLQIQHVGSIIKFCSVDIFGGIDKGILVQILRNSFHL